MFTSPPCKRGDLIAALTACRDRTLALFADVTPEEFSQQLHPDFSPLGWHLGHIGFTERLWILEHLAALDLPPDPLRQLWAADGLPKAQRQQLPDFAQVCAALAEVRSRLLKHLQGDPEPATLPLWCWLLQHESQHNETITFLKQYHRGLAVAPQGDPLPPPDLGMVKIAGGLVIMGNDSPWGQDNERPRYSVEVEPFWCDRFPVTNHQYQAFIAAGGYGDRQYWTPEGWQWRSQNQITQPRYWQGDPTWQYHPVCGVSHYEAAAYARFVGKRLPTEAEWETAAG
ncbi:MAG: ergothioneine biosynthesis protein EgtB, partial [Spirulina sp. DLM2.Bin59]